MKISKAGLAASGGAPEAEDLNLIRRFARAELKPEEVYTFPVILCDNEIDRDYERFDEETLHQLAELFAGKTGISDHEWRSGNQVARIYRAEVVHEADRTTAAGETYAAVRAWAYMLRTEANAALIADIEGGIKKEVSVGCAVEKRLCSVCGRPIGAEGCAHVKGETYGGRLCHAVLSGASDAYEWSFVAVPAQRGAGVTKAAVLSPDAPELETLRAEAALGRRYLAELRGEVKRLALICGREFYEAAAPALGAMDADALLGLKGALETRAAEKLPLKTQLRGANAAVRFDERAYQV